MGKHLEKNTDVMIMAHASLEVAAPSFRVNYTLVRHYSGAAWLCLNEQQQPWSHISLDFGTGLTDTQHSVGRIHPQQPIFLL